VFYYFKSFILLALLLTACSDYKIHTLNDPISGPGDVVEVDTAEPDEPDPPDPVDTGEPAVDPVYPDIEVMPLAIDFGSLNAVGTTASEVVTVKNTGDDTLNIADIRLDLGGIVYSLSPIGSTAILPGDESQFIATYDPSTYETNIDAIIIISNDPDEPIVNIPILGMGDAPVIEIDPDYYNFGTTLVGCDGYEPVTITNIGNVDLHVTDLDYFVTFPADLLIDQDEATNGPLPWIIAPGESRVVYIGHVPTDILDDEGYLNVSSNDPVDPVVRSDHLAEGAYSRVMSERFEQEEISSADILFVIDNSGSMGVWQTALTDNFNSFIGVFALTGVDYQIAVITTDDENFQGDILTDATPDLETEFTDQAIAGTYGSSMEKGLHYAELATLPGGDAAPGSDFLRSDSKLIIIFVSDEKDWSSKTDTEYEAHFKSLKTSDSMVVTHAVVGDSPSGCTSPTGTWTRADYGEGYIEVSALMGGEFVSICSSDWGADLETLAHDSILQRSFDLADAPIEESIVVSVDGTETSEWSYNTEENSVYFEESALPSGGSEIIIEYAVLAECE